MVLGVRLSNALTYDLSTLQWCQKATHLVETVYVV